MGNNVREIEESQVLQKPERVAMPPADYCARSISFHRRANEVFC